MDSLWIIKADVSLLLLKHAQYLNQGAFMSGNPGLYKGKYFMDDNIVLVTLAYRVGSFGKHQ